MDMENSSKTNYEGHIFFAQYAILERSAVNMELKDEMGAHLKIARYVSRSCQTTISCKATYVPGCQRPSRLPPKWLPVNYGLFDWQQTRRSKRFSSGSATTKIRTLPRREFADPGYVMMKTSSLPQRQLATSAEDTSADPFVERKSARIPASRSRSCSRSSHSSFQGERRLFLAFPLNHANHRCQQVYPSLQSGQPMTNISLIRIYQLGKYKMGTAIKYYGAGHHSVFWRAIT